MGNNQLTKESINQPLTSPGQNFSVTCPFVTVAIPKAQTFAVARQLSTNIAQVVQAFRFKSSVLIDDR
uniref:Uncharacterized protein n=1 Tax=Romanomermis culicivorax TaxID=13658 RepID=A0A915KK90_ROMCU